MPRDKCVVPSCNFRRSKRSQDSRSMFKCPKNPIVAQRWADNIPGVDVLLNNDHICERHFDPTCFIKYQDRMNSVTRMRLDKRAIPTLFDCYDSISYAVPAAPYTYSEHNMQYEASVPQLNSSTSSNYFDSSSSTIHSQSKDSFEVSQIELRDSLSKLPRIENYMKDVVRDLKASEEVLINIKKEEFDSEISTVKAEPTEDVTERFREGRKSEMAKFTVYQYVKYNKQHLTSLLPESWNIFLLPICDDEVISFSKECTINENIGLLVMYEKNIVIYRNGDTHYSVHGKRLKDIELENLQKFPPNISNTELMLKVLQDFDEVKVCQGLIISEIEINNDCSVYKDDLSIRRHVKCSLITDTQQCDSCYHYNQVLTSNMIKKSQVLTNLQPSYNDNNQLYYFPSSR